MINIDNAKDQRLMSDEGTQICNLTTTIKELE